MLETAYKLWNIYINDIYPYPIAYSLPQVAWQFLN